MSTKTLGKGIGSTWIKIKDRVVEFFHDDAGYFNFGGKRFYVLTGTITPGSTATTAPDGSIGLTTGTGLRKIYVSDGSFWQRYNLGTAKMVGHVVWGAVATATTTAGITQLSLNGIADGGTASGIVQPKTPRNVTMTITDANAGISAFSITCAGKAPDGTTISETFVFAGGLVQVGSKVFASVTSWTVNSIVGDGAGDVLDTGYGSKLGVPVPYGATLLTVQKLIADGTIEAAAAVDATNNSVTPTTAANGTKIFETWFSYDFPA